MGTHYVVFLALDVFGELRELARSIGPVDDIVSRGT